MDKFESRRTELAEAALSKLGQVGFAGASLREIAQDTDFSHGVFHYYFDSRDDLIACAVREYKAVCATRYDEVVASARNQSDLLEGFCAKLLDTVHQDHAAHRLWYDMRAQAMFNQALQSDVIEIDQLLEDMIWRVTTRYFSLAGLEPRATSQQAYAIFDGFFQRLLITWLATGEPNDHNNMRPMVQDTLRLLG